MTDPGVATCLEKLRARTPNPVLAPQSVHSGDLNREIANVSPSDLVKSLFYLWNDDLDASHDISQEVKTQDGSYLHGVMHRREADYGNSKYWFNRVGRHEVFKSLPAAAIEEFDAIKGPSKELKVLRKAFHEEWDPLKMVDWCLASDRGQTPADVTAFLQALQVREFEAIATWLQG